jgi:ABC-type transport system involved in cytochrome c biogenesis permease subunit
VHNAESLLAFLIMVVFMLAYLVYKTTTPGIVVFPLVFLLTFVASTGQQPLVFTADVVKKGWLPVHILMIFTGYAALFLSFGASILYLMQERALKSKGASGMFSRLPALQVIDDIGYRSLMIGFPFMTLGLVAGSVVAESTYGRVDFFDPKILLSVLMWAVYLLMVFMRLSAGWRGRRAALLASMAFVAAIVAWIANYFSGMHRFIAS